MSQVELVTRASLVGAAWWKGLSASEQRVMLIETQALTEEMVKFGMSRLAIGEHLENIRSVLQPKGKFVNYLKTQCRFSKATAYRYIEIYMQVRNNVPDVILRTAIARGYNVINSSIVRELPPPKTQDHTKIVKYLEKIEEAQKKQRSSEAEGGQLYDSDTLMSESLNFVSMRYKRLPDDNKARAQWVDQLVGMLLSNLGVRKNKVFTPIDVPERFKVVRGRPKTITAA